MDAWRTVVQRRMAVHTHPIDLVHEEGVRRRDATWIGVLYRQERRVFDSRTVALVLKSERGARWLIGLVRTAVEADVFVAPGSTGGHRAPLVWDASTCTLGPLRARVAEERGTFGVRVSRGADDVCDFRAIADVEVRTGDAGRFLAELAIDLATAGHAIPPLGA